MRMEGFWPTDDDPADQPASVDDPKVQMEWDDDDDDEEPDLDDSDQDEDDDWD